MEQQIKIEAKGDTILLGKHVIELKDKTSASFETDDLEHFKEYIAKSDKDHILCCNETSISLIPNSPDKFKKITAICRFSDNEKFVLVRDVVKGREITIDALEEKFKRILRQMNKDGIELLSSLQNFSISKITSVEKKKEQNGNFNYMVSMENSGKNNFVPPQTIVFKTPVIKGFDEEIEIEASVYFNFKANTEGVSANFRFECFDFDEDVKAFRKELILNKLDKNKFPFYWGKIEVKEQTDKDMYMLNGVDNN